MESINLSCQKSPGEFFGEYRVSVLDAKGEEITGKMSLREKYLRADILEHHGDKALVLFPKGLSKEIAWINDKYLLN